MDSVKNNASAVLINSPSRNYEVSPKKQSTRGLTPYGLASIATYAQNVGGVQVKLIDAENLVYLDPI